MVYEINLDDLVKGMKEYGNLIRIIPEDSFIPVKDFSLHPIESYLRREGIVYYFKGDGIENETDYEIDLNQIKVICSETGRQLNFEK